MPFFQNIKNSIVKILSCCNEPEPTLQIGNPTNFRKQDVCIPGLTEEQQALIREKAILDANHIVAGHLPSPLCSPSQNTTTTTMTSSHPLLHQHQHQQQGQGALSRVRQHTRKISQKFCGYHPVHPVAVDGVEETHTPYSDGDDFSGGSTMMLTERSEKSRRGSKSSGDEVTLAGGEFLDFEDGDVGNKDRKLAEGGGRV